ncbi:MAG: 7-carboxy-7-deazaguanine synthase QueE [Thermoguttaceae bacterium]
MQFAEIFVSRQGEGCWTGTPSLFLRTQGCPLSCWFCDTPYAQNGAEPAEILTVEQVMDRVQQLAQEHVVITGGEPFLDADLVELTQRLHEGGYIITIETAGLIDLPVHCDLISISPKLSNSAPQTTDLALLKRHEQVRNRPEIVRHLIQRYPYQLKFVVDVEQDLDEITAYLSELSLTIREKSFTTKTGELDRGRIYLMPEGTDATRLLEKETWLRPLCEQHGFSFCPRMHVHWFGNQRGT